MRCTISQISLIKYSTCFGQVHRPSSGVSQHCIHATGICHARTSIPDSHPHTVTKTKCRTDTAISPDDGHTVAQNM